MASVAVLKSRTRRMPTIHLGKVRCEACWPHISRGVALKQLSFTARTCALAPWHSHQQSRSRSCSCLGPRKSMKSTLRSPQRILQSKAGLPADDVGASFSKAQGEQRSKPWGLRITVLYCCNRCNFAIKQLDDGFLQNHCLHDLLSRGTQPGSFLAGAETLANSH